MYLVDQSERREPRVGGVTTKNHLPPEIVHWVAFFDLRHFTINTDFALNKYLFICNL